MPRLLVLALLLGAAGVAHADDAALPSMAVQNRVRGHTHEFSFAAGLLPMDAFEKGLTLSGGYTWHFHDLWAWEALQYTYSFPLETDLRGELRTFDLQPTPFERVEAFATTNLVFKPVYWKGAWLNDGLAFGEFFGVIGGGYGWLTRSRRPVVDAGVGVRLYAGEWLSVRFDIRELLFITEDDVHDELWLGLGFSI
ncbi:MAG: outer membrane beta-barrel domain-containing protein [Myxococcales bacterium]|nr:outer membrane beta-barrel domain-containing protein [Myxococcales bacterium]MCB9524585.1 outer membrane beta-barrel domain-containing protein [Myxococcales bacterium]